MKAASYRYARVRSQGGGPNRGKAKRTYALLVNFSRKQLTDTRLTTLCKCYNMLCPLNTSTVHTKLNNSTFLHIPLGWSLSTKREKEHAKDSGQRAENDYCSCTWNNMAPAYQGLMSFSHQCRRIGDTSSWKNTYKASPGDKRERFGEQTKQR